MGANGFRVSSRTYLSMGMWTLFSLRPSLLGAQVTAREVVDSDRLPFWPEVTVHDTTEDCLYSTGNGTSPHAAGRLRVFVTVGADEPVLVADEFAEGCAGRSAHVDLRALADVTEPVRLRIVREVWLRAEAVTLRGRASYWREATLSVTAG